MKHKVCCKEAKFDRDFSNYLRFKILNLSVKELLPFISPRIYDIDFLAEPLEEYEPNSEVIMPNVYYLMT